MRVSGSRPSSIQKAQSSTAKGKAAAGNKTSMGDKVQVSDAATLREMAHTMMADMPEVRLESIEAIRDALEQVTFQYNSKKVATQIVRNALAEHTWE